MKRLVCLLTLAACGGGGEGTTIRFAVGDEAPAYGDTPFPTDAVRDGATLGAIAGLDKLVALHADLVTAHVAALDGFGLRPLVEFFVDNGELDPASIAGAAHVVDVDPNSPEHGREIAVDWRYDAGRGVLAGAPHSGQILREGTRYAAYLTTAVRDTDGHALERAGALSELARHERWRTTADALAELDGAHDLAAITVFTTQHATAPLLAARDVMRAATPPVLAFANPDIIFSGKQALDRVLGTATRETSGPRAGLERWGNDNPTGMAHDHVGVVGTGTMTITRFRGDDTGTDLPDDETFQLDANGVPRLIAVDEIPVTFILPAAAPPATGYPVVIYGHGLGASRDQLLGFAEPLTSQGYALVGIDMDGHGSRFSPTDVVANLGNQMPQFTGVKAMPDGFGDTTGLSTTFDFFEGFTNVAAVRDSIRQSALDLSRLAQLLRDPTIDLSPLRANAKLDTSHLAYLGESFGTVVGTVFAAIEPDIDLYVLDVPGGGILDILLPDSAEIGTLALPLITSIYKPIITLDHFSPMIGLMQSVIDGADPLTYAPHVLADRFPDVKPRSIVLIEVVGDQVLSNHGTNALAQELTLDIVTPHLTPPEGLADIASPAAANRPSNTTAALVQYSPATHGANWSSETGVLRFYPDFPTDNPDERFRPLPEPVTIAEPIYETWEQVWEILASHQAGAAPSVRITKPPVADFDGDGIPDSEDPTPFGPAVNFVN